MTKLPTRVLLVDDDGDDYENIRELLQEIPHQKFVLDWEPNFEKARELILKQTHDVYLVDYRLGLRTGLDLFKETRAAGCRKPMIILTGLSDKDLDFRAMEAGASDYLVKSHVSTHLLERSIRYAIHRSEMESQILLQDRLASIGLLASGLAHDLGTPLGVVRGRAEYALLRMADSNGKSAIEVKEKADAIRKDLSVIISEIDRLSNLVKTLLGFAKGTQTDSTGSMSLPATVKDVADLLHGELKKRAIALQINFEAGYEYRVRGEVERFHQVLVNLLINAIHAIDVAMKQGRTDGHFIRLEAYEDNSSVSLLVQDSGCGISKENLSKLFTPFFTTKEPGRGTGLGLVTAGWLVQVWGGKISVESQEGVGTRFKIRLLKC